MSKSRLHFLRPYCYGNAWPLSDAAGRAHLRFHHVTKRYNSLLSKEIPESWVTQDAQPRLKTLQDAGKILYPRVKTDHNSLSTEPRQFHQEYQGLQPNEHASGQNTIMAGRVQRYRSAGSKLLFVDLIRSGIEFQAMCNFSKIGKLGCSEADFRAFMRNLQRGDIISVRGCPYRSGRGELTLNATELPTVLARCLHPVPEKLTDMEFRVRNRHADMLVNPQSAETIRLRSHITNHIRAFFRSRSFVEVETPILAQSAGGATARPFETRASEFPERELSMRIAPELWLKRLVIGGLDKVFEIGKCFRNEGLDQTHNPEFTTCESYQAYADLDHLIDMTEKLLRSLAKDFASSIDGIPPSQSDKTWAEVLRAPDVRPLQRISFVPTIQRLIEQPLPDLTSPEAPSQLLDIFKRHDIPLPAFTTLPRLLDRLSSHFLEPMCKQPTFITHPPECLAPLAKSFYAPEWQQWVSARAELFIDRCEIANMYEEENSPFEQRRKFEEQLRYVDADAAAGAEEAETAKANESYLAALEWGLPPTGGWGCGVDRLCMLFLGAERIGDVLSFGNLRNVVSLK